MKRLICVFCMMIFFISLSISSVYSEEFWENGDWVLDKIQRDDDNNGEVDSVWVFNYDNDGILDNIEIDNGDDGSVDTILTIIYDSNGRSIRWESDDFVKTFTRDSNGDIIKEIHLEGADIRVTYYGDAKDEVDEDNDGITDVVFTSFYDSNGYKVKMEEDEHKDNIIDGIYTYTYDSNGNRTKIEEDDDIDGDTDRLETYIWKNITDNPHSGDSDGGGDSSSDQVNSGTSGSDSSSTCFIGVIL